MNIYLIEHCVKMFIEYLFDINPYTMILICLSTIFILLFYYYPLSSKSKNDISKIEIMNSKFLSTSSLSINLINNEKNISLLSYNIMAYNFTKASWFSYCDPEFLHPKYRAPRIFKEIKQLNPDIICLQECDLDLFNEFYKPNFDLLGYESVFNISNPNRIVTIVIIFKKAKLNLTQKFYLDLNEDLEKIDESFIKHKEALICLFKHKESNKNLIIVNTHLFWNPEYEYVKYGQISKVLKYLEKQYLDEPIFLCGDFNSVPWSNVLRYIYRIKPMVNSNTKGDYFNNKKFMEKFFNEDLHHFTLASAYENYKLVLNQKEFKNFNVNVDEIKFNEITDNHPEFTNFTEEFNGCLDYIIYTKNKISISDLLEIPNNLEIKNLKLPNYKFPSDHLKIGCKFFIN